MQLLPATFILFVGSIAFWQGVSMLSNAAEPWDSPAYGVACLIALAIALAAGMMMARGAWLIGLAISFAQLPVMLWHGGVDPLMVVGILILIAMSLPLMGVAAVGTKLGKQRAN